ncbi:MAG: CRISPR system precrRNA processing endoribonuclease RAMP protein Cas6 [Candidatus Bathyarchaeia archaeon]
MHRFLFDVVASARGVLPPFTGHLVRAAFLSMVQKHSPSLAHRLHEAAQIRPYATTPLRSKKGQPFARDQKTGAIFIHENNLAKFSINSLTTPLGREIIDIVLKDLADTEFELSQTPFRVIRVSVESLDPSSLLKPPQRVAKFRLDFRTPTYFSAVGTTAICRFPDPVRIFGNLASLWNECIAPELGDLKLPETDFINWVYQAVVVTGYRLWTRTTKLAQTIPLIGFEGFTHFAVVNPSNHFAPWIHPLLMLGTFSNIGQGRTAGFGVTYYSPHHEF